MAELEAGRFTRRPKQDVAGGDGGQLCATTAGHFADGRFTEQKVILGGQPVTLGSATSTDFTGLAAPIAGEYTNGL